MNAEIRIVRTRLQAAVLLGIVVLSRPGCSNLDGNAVVLTKGLWGGQHMLLEIDDAMTRVKFDCARGTVDLPVLLAEGHFNVTGTFTPEHGGSIRDGEQVESVAARYFGRVRGDIMTVTVNLPKEKRNIGTFELRRGNAGRVFKCL